MHNRLLKVTTPFCIILSDPQMKLIASFLLLVSLVSASAVAQNTTEPSSKMVTQIDSVVLPRPRTSPVALAQYKSGEKYIRVVYGQPLKRGREIFGVLEPFGQVWRTGANEATEITFTSDVRINGKPLRAGTYTLFSIPNASKWTIIFNSELGQWGAFSYNAAKNVLTTEVAASSVKEIYEAFTIKFEETRNGVDMQLIWDKTKVAVPIAFER